MMIGRCEHHENIKGIRAALAQNWDWHLFSSGCNFKPWAAPRHRCGSPTFTVQWVGTAPSLAGSGRDWAAIGRQHGPRPSPEPVHVTLGPALLTSAREMTHAATISSSSSGWWWWSHSATLCHYSHPMTSPPPPWGSAPPPASPAVLTIAQVCRCRCEPSPASPPSMCPVPLMLPSPPSHNFTICNWL